MGTSSPDIGFISTPRNRHNDYINSYLDSMDSLIILWYVFRNWFYRTLEKAINHSWRGQRGLGVQMECRKSLRKIGHWRST